MISIWLAFFIDLAAGDPYWLPHPIRLIGRLIQALEKIIRKLAKKDIELKLGGVLLTILTVAVTYAAAFILLKLAEQINIWVYNALNIFLMYTCLAGKCLADEGTKIEKALASGDTVRARKLVSYIVGRDTEKLSESEITRATVETIAENTSDGVIAPLLFILLGGAPLGLAYKAINTLDSMVGYKNKKYLHIGWASAKLDDLANFIPARVTGVLMVTSAFFLRLNAEESFKIMLRDRKNHSSPNCGYPEAAAAGALGVQLGGTNYYFGEPVYKPTIGDNKRALDRIDIRKTIKLMFMSSIEALIIASLIFIILGVL